MKTKKEQEPGLKRWIEHAAEKYADSFIENNPEDLFAFHFSEQEFKILKAMIANAYNDGFQKCKASIRKDLHKDGFLMIEQMLQQYGERLMKRSRTKTEL